MKENGSALFDGGGSVDAATVNLGQPGCGVLAAAEDGGELELLVETTQSLAGRPRCGVVPTLHDS